MALLYPVILSVPAPPDNMPMPEQVARLSLHAREAVKISAHRSGLEISGKWPKDEDGGPIPDNGVYWSLTHKPKYVAGIAALTQIGIDLERIQPRNTLALFKKAASEREWELAPAKDWSYFYRFWTAKEAVLKAAGIGLKELSDCRITAINDERHLTLQYRNRLWQVEHLYFEDHIASLVQQNDAVRWTVLNDHPSVGEEAKPSPDGGADDR